LGIVERGKDMNFLFVGGPKDGKVIEIKEEQLYHRVYVENYYRVYVENRNVSFEEKDSIKERKDFLYVLFPLYCGQKRLSIYVPKEWNIEMVIESLVKNYRPL
jgi:hypothetical protein